MDEIIVHALVFILACICTFVGVVVASPTELPNGCILHDDNIYCLEEVSE